MEDLEESSFSLPKNKTDLIISLFPAIVFFAGLLGDTLFHQPLLFQIAVACSYLYWMYRQARKGLQRMQYAREHNWHFDRWYKQHNMLLALACLLIAIDVVVVSLDIHNGFPINVKWPVMIVSTAGMLTAIILAIYAFILLRRWNHMLYK